MHKGFFYYIFQLLFLPFKILLKILKFLFKKLKILISDIDEVNKDRIKRKNLNKWLVKNRLKEEIV